MFMARRDSNQDLFHLLTNSGCKNTLVIPIKTTGSDKARKPLSGN